MKTAYVEFRSWHNLIFVRGPLDTLCGETRIPSFFLKTLWQGYAPEALGASLYVREVVGGLEVEEK
jgi:hypothetical protein